MPQIENTMLFVIRGGKTPALENICLFDRVMAAVRLACDAGDVGIATRLLQTAELCLVRQGAAVDRLSALNHLIEAHQRLRRLSDD